MAEGTLVNELGIDQGLQVFECLFATLSTGDLLVILLYLLIHSKKGLT
jgi:hypothetical protein